MDSNLDKVLTLVIYFLKCLYWIITKFFKDKSQPDAILVLKKQFALLFTKRIELKKTTIRILKITLNKLFPKRNADNFSKATPKAATFLLILALNNCMMSTRWDKRSKYKSINELLFRWESSLKTSLLNLRMNLSALTLL